MPPDLEPILLLILPKIISPVTTRRKKSRLKKSQRSGVPLRKLLDTPLLQGTSIATEVNCVAPAMFDATITSWGRGPEEKSPLLKNKLTLVW